MNKYYIEYEIKIVWLEYQHSIFCGDNRTKYTQTKRKIYHEYL